MPLDALLSFRRFMSNLSVSKTVLHRRSSEHRSSGWANGTISVMLFASMNFTPSMLYINFIVNQTVHAFWGNTCNSWLASEPVLALAVLHVIICFPVLQSSICRHAIPKPEQWSNTSRNEGSESMQCRFRSVYVQAVNSRCKTALFLEYGWWVTFPCSLPVQERGAQNSERGSQSDRK